MCIYAFCSIDSSLNAKQLMIILEGSWVVHFCFSITLYKISVLLCMLRFYAVVTSVGLFKSATILCKITHLSVDFCLIEHCIIIEKVPYFISIY